MAEAPKLHRDPKLVSSLHARAYHILWIQEYEKRGGKLTLPEFDRFILDTHAGHVKKAYDQHLAEKAAKEAKK